MVRSVSHLATCREERRPSRATRDLLAETAVRLWGERSYAEVSVQDIVEAAHLAKGGFYHHFRSKGDLLRQIHDEVLDRQIRDIQSIVSRGLTAGETIRLVLERFFGHFGESRLGMVVVLQEMRSLEAEAMESMRAKRSVVEQLWVDILERGRLAGEIKAPGDLRMTAFAMIGILAWSYEWFDPEGPVTPSEFARLTTSLILEGLAPRPA